MLKKVKLLSFIFLFLSFINFSLSNENLYEEGKKKYNEKKFEESKFIFQRSIVFNPKNSKSYLFLAKIYNLEILQKNIEDESGNVTRFFIMGKNSKHPELKDKKYITSCIFKLKSVPAALYKSLGGFATNGVNLCKLESFAIKNTFDQVNFYIDIEGHIEEPRIQKALEELGFHTQKLDILGVYEAHEFRLKNNK